MKSWYLIYSKPREEKLAEDHLDRQGYKVYLPLISGRKKQRGRTIKIIQPMFPRYLFICLSDKTDDWRPIRSTIGVSTLVRFGNEPAKVPEKFIRMLKERETAEGYHPSVKTVFKEGDIVRIADGPFEGYEAIFSCQDAHDRVTIMLKIAEKFAKLKIEITSLEKQD